MQENIFNTSLNNKQKKINNNQSRRVESSLSNVTFKETNIKTKKCWHEST